MHYSTRVHRQVSGDQWSGQYKSVSARKRQRKLQLQIPRRNGKLADDLKQPLICLNLVVG